MDNALIALALGAVVVGLDLLLHHSHVARRIFADLAGRVPRKLIWTVFLSSIMAAAHLVSGWAMIALAVAIAVFAFVMAAWLSAANKP